MGAAGRRRRERPELAGASVVVCTDPPYYDYFAYSALSDYFHLWLREALGEAWPGAFGAERPPREGEVGPGGAAAFAASLGGIRGGSARWRIRRCLSRFYGYKQTSGPAWEASPTPWRRPGSS